MNNNASVKVNKTATNEVFMTAGVSNELGANKGRLGVGRGVSNEL